MDAGDWRGARPLAETLAASASGEDRAAAVRVLERLRPGPSARAAFLAGLAFFAAVAALGLLRR